MAEQDKQDLDSEQDTRFAKPVMAGDDSSGKRSKWISRLIRIAGNSLIAIGAILLLSVGAFYAYAEYKQAELTSRIAAQNQQSGDLTYIPILGTATPAPTPGTATGSPTTSDGESVSSFMPPSEPVQPTPTAGDEQATPTPTPVPKPPPTRIVIPKINVDAKVVEVDSHLQEIDGEQWLVWDVANYAAGHHKGSANPGEVGNIVITGHDDINGEVFRYLENLQPGDQITLYTDEGQRVYVVQRLELVREKGASVEERKQNAKYMAPTPDETLTLISCWPYRIDTHRLIVIAKPYEPAEGGGGPDATAR
ncbi:MAG: sortase [Chloroflexi bacterium]|nr:sortase [Chloroflexota bacterium]